MAKTLILPTLFVFSFGWLLYGCSERTSSGHYVRELNEVFHIDTVIITLDHHSNNYYENASAVFETDSTVCLVFYNRYTHSLDWFCLNNSADTKHTRLDRQGPDAIPGDLVGLYVHHEDSVFINDGMFLMLINKEGKVITKTSNDFKGRQGNFSLSNHSHLPMYYNSERNSIFGAAVQGGIFPERETPALMEVNMTDFSTVFHTVPLSDFFVSHSKSLRFNNRMNATFTREDIIYNFQSGSDIFVYNLKSGESNVFEAKSSLSKNQMNPLLSDNPDDEWKHFVENPRFFKVSFCPRNKVYYRLHWKEITFQGAGNDTRTPYDKPLILSVFDQNFNPIAEVMMPNDVYLISGAEQPTSRGFLMFASHPRKAGYDPEKVEFHFLSLKQNISIR